MNEQQLPATLRDRTGLSPRTLSALLREDENALMRLASAIGASYVPITQYDNRAEPWREHMVRLIVTKLER